MPTKNSITVLMKIVKAVAPYIYEDKCNFKYYLYKSWKAMNGKVAESHYPWSIFHSLVYKFDLPCLFRCNNEARLRFVSGFSIRFDTFPDYAQYEIIPVIWDCWPQNVPVVAAFLSKYSVKTAVFTSSQTADTFRQLFPKINILTITEGVELDLYHKGNDLKDRTIDVLEVGRNWVDFFKTPLMDGVNHVKTGNFQRFFNTDEDFRRGLADTKVTINVPRCDVDKRMAGDIETLTQRYWECMLSRVVMVGRAPAELIDLIGYDPMVSVPELQTHSSRVLDFDFSPLVNEVLANIEEYQPLVDKNHKTAMRMASWDIRVTQIADFLRENGYMV